MNRIDRLYALVEELRAAGPRGRTARQLAEHFELSVRTIERAGAGRGPAWCPNATAHPGDQQQHVEVPEPRSNS